MAGTIRHSWNGTILTIESDSGVSSMDLKGAGGPIGPRGAQGPAGVIVNSNGSVNLNGYATEEYVQDMIAGAQYEGEDGVTYTPMVDSSGNLSWTNNGGLPNPPTVNIRGQKGADGTVSFSDLTEEQKASLNGKDGHTPIKGVDYFTDAEKQEIVNGYRTLDNHLFDNTLTISNPDGTMNIYSNGIQGADNSLWIGGNGEGCFTDLKVGTVGNYKPVATQDYVATAIADALAALDGDGEDY